MWLAAAIWVKVLTGSNTEAGLTPFFFVLPTLFSPLSGYLADRVKRRPLLITVNFASAGVVLPLTAVRGPSSIWLIWTVMTLYGISNSIITAAQSAFLTVIVPGELLGEANGLLRLVREALRLVSPLVGAALFVSLGGRLIAIGDAVTFLLAGLFLLPITAIESAPATPPRSHWQSEIFAGVVFIYHHHILRRITLATSAVMLVAGFSETLGFVLVERSLHRSPAFVGVLVSAMGLGAIIGGSTAPALIRRHTESLLAALGMVAIGLGSLLWLVANVMVICLGSVVMGLGLPWVLVGAYTVIQRESPPELQGRAVSSFELATGTPQLVSIALGAALVVLVPYRALISTVAVTALASGSWLLRSTKGEWRDSRSPRTTASGERPMHRCR